jgi:hypothetical protein
MMRHIPISVLVVVLLLAGSAIAQEQAPKPCPERKPGAMANPVMEDQQAAPEDTKKPAAKAASGSAELEICVLKKASGKPVRNATVVLHPFEKDGRVSKGGLNLKTDSDGRARVGGMPFGKLRVQVIARGLRTFGEDYEIGEPEQQIVIKLEPPAEQHSIYKK